MPLKPIDLQTLFMQMNQVSKDQAAAREGAALQQAAIGQATEKKALERVKAVHNPEGEGGSAPKIDDHSGGGQAQGGEGRGREEKDGEESPAEELQVYTDPAVGRNVDITG